MSRPLPEHDPAYWMLKLGCREADATPDVYDWRSKPTVYQRGCYICEDPEYSLMGLPLCTPCVICGGHVPADDCDCNGCGANQPDAYEVLGL